MRILVDTNVLVSAILKDKTPEEIILYLIDHSESEIEWVASRDILQEYKEVLSRKKFNLPVPILEKWMKVLDKALTIVPVHKNWNM